MRLRRIDLVRYGHFTDASFELPRGVSDLCVVFGPNEAGKSTALTAIEDLLFGIPMHSPYNFLHDYSNMRIGAALENGGSSLEVRRRKGRKDTLLGIDDLPLGTGEGALRPFLAGADRSFFERMFSLDHIRLEEGGREILKANDEVGQMLFSAGSGIAGLKDRLTDLLKEADDLWGARRAARRLYTQAEDKLKDADKALREQTFTANKWQELKRAYETAEDAHAEVEKEFRSVSAEGRRLARIRRVHRYVRQKAELERSIQALGDAVLLPDNARQLLDGAERKESEVSTSIGLLSGQLVEARQELEGLTYDAALVLRADDVRHLHERRIAIRSEKADLPKRQAELNVAEDELTAFATELGWQALEISVLVERIPPRATVRVVRVLLGERGGLESNVVTRAGALEEAEASLTALQELIAGLAEVPDVSRLSAVVKTVRALGDVDGRLRTAEAQVRDADGRARRLLASLHPNIPNENDAAEMKVPPRAGVQTHRDLLHEWERRRREGRQKIEATDQALERARKELERTIRDEHAISAEELGQARDRRDTLWTLVKLKHIEQSEIPDEARLGHAEDLGDLPPAFEAAVRHADHTADHRFDNAEAAGRLAEKSQAIATQAENLATLQRQVETLEQDGEKLDARWREMWSSAPFEPRDPDAMLEWLEARGVLLDAIESRAQESGNLEKVREEQQHARATLLRELVALGVEGGSLENDSLHVVLERAADVQTRHDVGAQAKAQMDENVRKAASNVEGRQRELRRATEAWSGWQGKWSNALSDLGLATGLSPDAVAAQIDVIDQMRVTAAQINELRHQRIDKIGRDVVDFEGVVDAILRHVASDLLGTAADDAVLELERRLMESERMRDRQARKTKEVEDLEKKIAHLHGDLRKSQQSVNHLNEAAGTDTPNALKQAIERSDALRTCQTELAATLQSLEEEGDGFAFSVLEKECAEVDLDQIAAREDTISDDERALRGRLSDAAEVRSKARDAFQAIDDNDAAARAAAMRQEALTETREVAARYVRVRTSATLLQWAIDRYRREKQAPLLERAGRLFATITGGSFSGLRIEYDDQDQAHLAGLRPSGEIVRVSGMSTGTADPLYLALRVASVEDYLERADRLPFVADDLFVNFDDDRAAAGFEVLGQLARKTQVLFFTHHQHLVDIARSTLGESVNVVSLWRTNRAGK